MKNGDSFIISPWSSANGQWIRRSLLLCKGNHSLNQAMIIISLIEGKKLSSIEPEVLDNYDSMGTDLRTERFHLNPIIIHLIKYN